MTIAVAQISPRRLVPQVTRSPLLVLLGIVLSSVILAQFLPFLDKWPTEWIIPARIWVTDFFAWFAALAKPVTRALSWLLSQPLAFVEALLYRWPEDDVHLVVLLNTEAGLVGEVRDAMITAWRG